MDDLIKDQEKLKQILTATGITRSELAKRLETSYKTIYRWLDKGIKPHLAASRDIDELFKEYVDLRPVVLKLQKSIKNPIKLLKTNKQAREKFFIELTYNSNAIEGSRMTVRDTETVFAGKVVKGKELFEILEVTNHKNALEFLFENIRPEFKLDEKFILKIHALIMNGFGNKLPGKYRTGQVNLTNTDKALPSFQEVPLRMGKWLKTVNQYGKDSIAKMAADHYEFEAIHPFFDGNGRTGRLILLTQALSQSFAPPIVSIEDRYKYYTALSKGDFGDMKNLTQLICESLMRGYELLKE